MTRNPKIIFLCVLCIFVSGILVSYKSFEIHETFKKENSTKVGQEISAWVAESVELKLNQLEASVSYLDKSTVESLNRLGARYFAYAYKKNDLWEVKWKVLNEQMGKEQILSEVNAIEFDKVSTLERSWVRSDKQKLIFVTPVGLAKSHQLISGFLIFGIDKSFFKYIKALDQNLVFMDKNLNPIHQKLTNKELKTNSFFDRKNLGLGTHFIQKEEEVKSFTSYFSSLSQLWIVNQRTLMAGDFFSSPYLAYALLGSLLVSLLLFVFIGQMGERRVSVSRSLSVIPAWFQTSFLARNFLQFKRHLADRKALKEKVIEPTIGLIEKVEINNFSNFLDEVLKEDKAKLKKLGISIKIQVDKAARVYCSKAHLTDVIQRLIENSILSLENVEQKEIQIQLVESNNVFQFIYVDSRKDQFPTGHEPSLFLQTEGSMVGIDGIISYASWLFGKNLHIAKKGFCFSLDLDRFDEVRIKDEKLIPFVETLERIEISDQDMDLGMMDLFSPIQKDASFIEESAGVERMKDNLAELSQDLSIESSFESFDLKDLDFDDKISSEPKKIDKIKPVETVNAKIKTDKNGLFEFNSGQFKIKIRSPKKRDMDVDR